jgi:phosphate transport system protein
MITVMESPQLIGTALSLIFIGGNIERVADLATKIGEYVVYLVEGKTIRRAGESDA